jgi:acyl-CoA thioesterase I
MLSRKHARLEGLAGGVVSALMPSTQWAAALISVAWMGVTCSAPPVGAAAEPSCAAPDAIVRLGQPLPHTAAAVAAAVGVRSRDPLTIVAIGSSSTEGAGASAPDRTYPSRLKAELDERLPGRAIRVLNKGVGGETIAEMLARFDRDVLAEHPDLVIWQVGTNAVLRHDNIVQDENLLRRGIRRLKAAGLDLVLMDLQYAPKVLANPEYQDMLRGIAEAGELEGVPVFHRFAIMKHLAEQVGGGDQEAAVKVMLSPDRLHMNDWSYSCTAHLLAAAVVQAAVAEGPNQQIVRNSNASSNP